MILNILLIIVSAASAYFLFKTNKKNEVLEIKSENQGFEIETLKQLNTNLEKRLEDCSKKRLESIDVVAEVVKPQRRSRKKTK